MVGGIVGLWVVVVVVGGAQVLQHNFLTDGSLQFSLAQSILLSPNSQSETGHSKVIYLSKWSKVIYLSKWINQ